MRGEEYIKKLLLGLSVLLLFLVGGCATPNLADSKSEAELKEACDLNHGTACTHLGNLYRFGKGVKQDYSKTNKYYSKACSLNDSAGCFNLGESYFFGTRGMNRSYAMAKKYYSKACSLNNGYACWRLGGMYYSGNGVNKDYTKAEQYLSKSCKLVGSGCTLYKDLKSKGY